jgi:hypothetical protein
MRNLLLSAASALAMLLAADVARANSASSCRLGNGIKHIVYLQFDNVHLRRDNPNVPSDLEQIPSLLNFIKNNGVMLSNHHTPLISHTSVDIVTALTGVYGEKFGFAVGNSFGFFDPAGAPHFNSSFAYWTDQVNEGTSANPVYVPQMVDQRGKVHPAPWVPFTRAGCDVGAFSLANIEFENTTSDIDNVFGPTSAEHNENLANHAKALADFEGIALHCAQGSKLCAASPSARPDVLNDEPGGYTGFQALFGNKYLAPVINAGNGYVLDLDGNHIADTSKPPNDGFPGFNPTPSQSLGYVAQMLEAGVPVVYFYIEDAHDNHGYPGAPANPDGAFGPGEAGYVYQLKAYDAAFSKFFARLKADGITADNTLFVITADENDHFAGNIAAATPAGCDGVKVACTYPIGAKGEVDADLSLVFATEFGNTTPFAVHSDDAPTFHINGNPAQTSTITRTLERQAATLLGYDPNVGGDAKVTQALADQAEMGLLHMITHDPARTPNFVLFGNPDYFLSASGKTNPLCSPTADAANCFAQSRGFVWNHGDFQKDINVTWLGVVGPGVMNVGQTDAIFTDHTDIRPTILSLAHLRDDYAHDGRVVFEIMAPHILPESLRRKSDVLIDLANAYKRINAPTGPLGIKTLTGLSTKALQGSDANYARLDSKIVTLTNKRNAIASQMIAILEQAAFENYAVNEREARRLIDEAHDLLESVN